MRSTHLCFRRSFDDVTRINFRFRLLVAWSSPHGRDASSHKISCICLYPVRSYWQFSEIQYFQVMRIWPFRRVNKINKKGTKTLYFTHMPRSFQWMDFYQIWFRGSSRGHNQLCGILWQSAHGFRFCEGSHWLGRSPLTQCWRYRAACDAIVLWSPTCRGLQKLITACEQ